MAYLKINGNDYSMYVNKLKVLREHLYKSQANAAGNTIVKYVTTKRIIEVGIIPLDSAVMANLQKDINEFKVTLSFLDPDSNTLVENISCIIPQNSAEYYTIQAGKVKFKACNLQFKEL